MVVPSPLKRRELRRIEISEIDAAHLGAERSPGRNHVNRLTTNVARNFTLDAQNHRNLQRHGPIGKILSSHAGRGKLAAQPRSAAPAGICRRKSATKLAAR